MSTRVWLVASTIAINAWSNTSKQPTACETTQSQCWLFLRKIICCHVLCFLLLIASFSQRCWSHTLELEARAWSCLPGAFNQDGPAGATKCLNFNTRAILLCCQRMTFVKTRPRLTAQTNLVPHECSVLLSSPSASHCCQPLTDLQPLSHQYFTLF